MRSNRVRRTTKGPSNADGLFDWRKKTARRLGRGRRAERADDGIGVGSIRQDADETLLEDLVDEVANLGDVVAERGDEIFDGRRAEAVDGVEERGNQDGNPTERTAKSPRND